MYARIIRSTKNPRLYKRSYATENNPQGGSNSLLVGGLLAAIIGGSYIYSNSSSKGQAGQTNTGIKNPMVEEKTSKDSSKPNWETKVEQKAENETKDTTSLIDKDTNKAKDVWKEKDKKDDTRRVSASSANENNEGSSIWNRMMGQSNQEGNPTTQQRRSTGNPMVDEKLTSERTKTDKDLAMESHANEVTHDTSNLVDKDTKKIEHVWDDRSKPSLSGSPAEENKSFWSSLFGSSNKQKDADASWDQAKGKANEVKEDAAHTAQRDARKLSGAWEDAKDAASAEANSLKQDANSSWEQSKDKAYSGANEAKYQAQSTWDKASDKASNIYDSAQQKETQLKHEANDEYNYQKDRLNELHKEVSDNASRWKDQTEQKAKSWYDKGTEQVKTGLSSVKDAANQDIHWAEQKVHDGLNTAKDEMNYMMGKDKNPNGFKGHVLGGERFAEVEEGQLRPTRDQFGRVPARLVVEHARGTDM